MNKLITSKELAQMVMDMKHGEAHNISMSYDTSSNYAEAWVRIERMEYFDSEYVIMGGYGYEVETIANSEAINDRWFMDITKAIEAYQYKLGFDGCQMCIELEEIEEEGITV